MMSAIATSAATVTPSRQPSQIAVADPATAEATARPIQMGTRGSAESPDGAGRPAGAGLPSACWPGSSGSGDDPAGSPGSGDDPAGSPGSGDDPAGSPGSGDDPAGSPGSGDDPAGSPGSGDDPAGSPGSGDDPAGSPGRGDGPAARRYGQVSRSTFLRVPERIRKDE